MGTDGIESVTLVIPSFKGISSRILREARSHLGVLILAGAFAALATLAVVAAISVGFGLPQWWILAGLAVVAAVAERQGVRISRNIECSISTLPIVFAAIAFGPVAAAVVGAAANFLDLRPPYMRWFVYTPARALAACAAGFAGSDMSTSSTTFSSVLVASFLASAAYVCTDALVNILVLTARRTATAIAYARTVVPLVLVSLPLHVPLVALLGFAYRNYALWVVATLLIPALAMQRLIHLYQQQRDATRELAAANRHLEAANLSFATALVATLDARDRYTAGHSAAVAIYSRDIAERMALSEGEQRLAHLAGLVHDIGKIGLPAGLLEKAGPLSLEERRHMEEHSVIGERILANVEDYREVATVVRHHHERRDGNGYPDQLSGDDIPLISRIIAVADAYNAMTSDRPYRDAMPSRVARLRLAQAVESQFDTSVVAAFEAILASATDDYRGGTAPEFTFGVQSVQSTDESREAAEEAA